jgi:hypothetical protein
MRKNRWRRTSKKKSFTFFSVAWRGVAWQVEIKNEFLQQ